MTRVLLAGLFHEGNSFSSLVTDRGSFAIVEGPALLEKAWRSGTAMGGACRHLVRQDDVELVPVTQALAPPGGPVAHDLYLALRDRVVAAARRERPDALYFDLHGGMVTEQSDDPEGDLLQELRTAVGPAVPIAASLDLHAAVTPRMLQAADVLVACKENPHTDYDLAGARAAELLLHKCRDQLRPVTAAVWLPLVLGARLETAEGPLARLHERRRQLLHESATLLDISIYNTTALLDVAGAGQCVTATADGDPDAACEAAAILARALWEARDEFKPNFASADAVLSAVQTGELARPTILGDQGDRTLAGTAGDGTFMLRELLQHWPDLRALVPVTDPESVAAAQALGVGAVLVGGVGGRLSLGLEPVQGSWRIERLGDGHFIQEGPFLANEPARLGNTAILTNANVTVLATSLPGFTQDPAAFRSQGPEPADFDVVVTKSGYHFKLSFARLGPCVVVDTPGLSNYRPGLLPYRRRRPVYPEDRVPTPGFVAELF
jgi:microcystin degradation protein MlrC